MTDTASAEQRDIQHPAPQRGEVSLLAIVFGLVAAPTVWALHLTVNAALASSVCKGLSPNIGRDGALVAMTATGLTALGVSVIAAVVAYRGWRATQQKQESKHHIVFEVGEGRTRFLCVIGIVFSIGFFAASLFDLIAVYMVPLCAS
ncbi:hypothetical protein A7A08_02532 [Methyloligella halotolerans]|uniref:Uncharacterized protein n=1 Tax=Methyloligella halotolerans TaxID=1177755 RepID=A0A1E2RX13_9HYPH|nr:hypothetical protein [Methyloligella halotolerans]ODA66764.1 hypothetical protein A7A08_02532 [Methyloligella halotolerans]